MIMNLDVRIRVLKGESGSNKEATGERDGELGTDGGNEQVGQSKE